MLTQLHSPSHYNKTPRTIGALLPAESRGVSVAHFQADISISSFVLFMHDRKEGRRQQIGKRPSSGTGSAIAPKNSWESLKNLDELPPSPSTVGNNTEQALL